MAKISPVSIKYMIYVDFEAEGTVEKPDVIGAVFGQTEGLLGSDLEMRDLQKEGKIGRIEVQLEKHNSKTIGKIQVPSALDKTETTLIAAAVETIDRIGPSTAKIKVDKIEDVRGSKREYILERAKKLLGSIEEKMPKTRELAKNVKQESRTDKIKEYGKEKLPVGNIDEEEIIVVEGRADVLNLLRNNVNNVIGMDGTNLPKTIKELSYDKELILFVDGDRGGKLIVKNAIDNARIDYVAFAPHGREVEELSGKEILSSLRKKIPAQEFLKGRKTGKIGKKEGTRIEEKTRKKTEEKAEEGKTDLDNIKLKSFLDKVENTRSVLLLDKKLETVDKANIRGIFSFLKNKKDKVEMMVVDKATPTIIKAAEENNIKYIVARNFSAGSDKVELISL